MMIVRYFVGFSINNNDARIIQYVKPFLNVCTFIIALIANGMMGILS